MSADKSGSPPCGIYVRIDPSHYKDMPKTITALRQMSMTINRASGYEKNMTAVCFVYDKNFSEEITDLTALVQAEGLVALVSHLEDAEVIQNLGVDGAVCAESKIASLLRQSLGEDAIIGVACGSSRAQAELALAVGVDFVTLMADPALVQWFCAQGDTLCVAEGRGITNDNCGVLALSGAAFVEATSYIFGHEKGVMQGTVNMLYALDLALQELQRYN